MLSDFQQGFNHMKDNMICVLVGFQNEQGNDVNSEEYKAYQKVLDFINENYGG